MIKKIQKGENPYDDSFTTGNKYHSIPNCGRMNLNYFDQHVLPDDNVLLI